MRTLLACTASLTLVCAGAAQNWKGRNGPGRGFRVGAAAAPGGAVLQFGGTTDSSLSPPSYFWASAALGSTWRYGVPGWEHMQTAGGPPPLYQPMMCYDSVRDRTVLYGGLQIGFPNLAGQTWEWDGSGWHLVVTSQSPPALTSAAFAFDVGRGVVVLHGGLPFQAPLSTQTWEYDGQQWLQVQTNTTPTPAGWGAQGMAYAPALGVCVQLISGPLGPETWHYDGVDWTHNTAVQGTSLPFTRMATGPGGGVVLVGRQLVSGAVHETWRYDGVSWQQLMPTNPPPILRDNWAVYDPSRNVVLQAEHDEVWSFDGVDWTQEFATRMQRTGGAAIAFDAQRERLVMFGGWKAHPTSSIVMTNEHWEWDGLQWQQRTFPVMPSPRADLAACYDRARGRMVVCETEGPSGQLHLSEVWEFDGQSWTNAGTVPVAVPRIAAMAYDVGRRACVVLTLGSTWPYYNHKLWTYDGANWTELPTPTKPPFRDWSVFAYDEARDCIVLHGGGSGGQIYSDTWEYVGGDWQQRQPQIRPTTGALAGAYEAVRGRVVVRSHHDSAMWEWDGTIWHALSSVTPPPMAHSHRMFFDPTRQELVGLGWFAEVSAWRPDPVPHWASTGFACLEPGSSALNPPTLAPAASSSPALGTTLTLEVQDLNDANAPVLLLLGQRADVVAGQVLPLDLTSLGLPGCQLWVAPEWTDASFAVGGVASFALPLPANPALAGSHLWAQAVEVSTGGPLLIGGLSNAGVATLH